MIMHSILLLLLHVQGTAIHPAMNVIQQVTEMRKYSVIPLAEMCYAFDHQTTASTNYSINMLKDITTASANKKHTRNCVS